MNSNTLECLKGARVLIAAPEHWIKGAMVHYKPGQQLAYCLAGALRDGAVVIAIRQFMDWQGLHLDAIKEVVHQIHLSFGDPKLESIVDWNDHPKRTHSDVLSVLDQSIARLEAQLL